MDAILRLIASYIYDYAVAGAGMPSYRGTFEQCVPEKLKAKE